MNAFGLYDQIRWIDQNGKERLRINFIASEGRGQAVAAQELADKSDRYYFKDSITLPPGAIYLSPFDLNIEKGRVEHPVKPTLRAAAPLFNQKGERHGILIINYNGRILLDALMQSVGARRDHLFWLNQDGYWLRSPRQEDEWGFMLERPERTLARINPKAWARLSSAETGQEILDDGLWTWDTLHPLSEMLPAARFPGLAAWAPLTAPPAPDQLYSWILAAHLPDNELAEISRQTWRNLSLPLFLFLLTIFLASLFFAQSRRKILDLNDDLQQRALEAESANRSKAQFLANMSHEIRTPMNAVLGLVYLLEQRHLGQKERDLVEKIRVAGQCLLSVINDILDFSKIEAGRLEIERIAFNLNDVLDNVAAVMTATAGNKTIELIVGAPPPEIGALVGDPQRLQQVLINLTSNAVKFTDDGEVSLSVSMTKATAKNLWLRFSVRDTGIGIPREKQAVIFSSFSQADMSTTRRFGGTGLGLAICRHLVELMGGDIGVISEPGRGSEFWITLPFGRTILDGFAVPVMALQTVLVVDDNVTARETLATIARSLGWDAECAESGDAAVALVSQRASEGKFYDVVLMDWRMPGLNGLAAGKAIRDVLNDRQAPIVVMVTSYAREDLMEEADIGIADVILDKPVTASSAFNAVAKAKRRRGLSGWRDQKIPSLHRRLSGLRILVVDDSQINREVAQRILEGEGARVTLAGNGQEAVDILRGGHDTVDAVLMDVQMPVMDGYEATQMIRATPSLATLPVVALTAGAFKAQQDAALAAGMTGFIPKPFEVNDMVATLLRVTGTEPGAEPGRTPSPGTASPGGMEPIDFATGLRHWGEAAAYHNALRRFLQAHGNAGDQIATLIGRQDREEAGKIAHNLTGTAANLALNRVARTAARITVALENGSDDVSADIDAVRAALAEARILVDREAPTITAGPVGPDSPDAIIDGAAVAVLLDRLLQALDHDNPDESEPILAALAAMMPADRIRPIEACLDGFDFRAAELQTRILAKSVGLDFPGGRR